MHFESAAMEGAKERHIGGAQSLNREFGFVWLGRTKRRTASASL
jgi:hypothetical protein